MRAGIETYVVYHDTAVLLALFSAFFLTISTIEMIPMVLRKELLMGPLLHLSLGLLFFVAFHLIIWRYNKLYGGDDE